MEIKTAKQLEHNVNFAKQISKSSVDSIDLLWKSLQSKRKSTTEQIQQYLDNPVKYSTKLQESIEMMMVLNGVLREIILYKSNILTYDHYIIADMTKYDSKDKLDKDYKKSILELKKYNIKFNCRWIIDRVIRKGELYTWKLESKEGITLTEIPSKLCKVVGANGAIQKYSINLQDIKEESITYFPIEIQKLYKKYKDGKLKSDKNLKDGYYKLDFDNAVAFTIEYLQSKGVPYYASLLRDLSVLNDMQDVEQTSAMVDNFKVLHMLIPTDDEGNISVDADEAIEYFNALKMVCPDGVAPIGMPYKLNPVTLGDSKEKKLDYTNKLKKGVFDNAAINDDIFSGTKSNNQAIIYGADVDSLLPMNLLEKVRLWLNSDFKNNKALKNFEIQFVDSTVMNKTEKIKLALSCSASWNSRLQLFAYMGHDPYDAYNLLRQEQMMDLDSLMIPLMTSHTATSSDTGRPSASDDDTTSGNVGQAQN